MREKVWELACPGCAEGRVRIVQQPSRAEIDAMLPDSMRAPAVGKSDARSRFEAKEGCSGCGFDAGTLAQAVEADGLPEGAVEVSEG